MYFHTISCPPEVIQFFQYLQLNMLMSTLTLLLVLLLFSVVVSAICHENPFIKTLELALPVQNSLVSRTFYTKMSAEVKMDLTDFRAIQREFEICAIATVESSTGPRTVFEECGRSVFGQGQVSVEEGVNHLHMTLSHNKTDICEVDVTISCCIDAETVAGLAAERETVRFQEFAKLGMEMISQVRDLVPHDSANDPTVTRYQNLLSGSKKPKPLLVLIGIKSGALNLVKRNSVRASWMRSIEEADLQEDDSICMIPFFLIGESPLASDNATVAEILSMEQRFYRDTLLGAQLPAPDSYLTLGEKVLAFARWTAAHAVEGVRSADYVVICDDDVFVDVWQLQNHLRGLAVGEEQQPQPYYAGEVLEVRMGETYKPIRDPAHRNHLPREHYPLDTLPPFALGNFYLLGGAQWAFLQRNAGELRPTGTLRWASGCWACRMHQDGFLSIQVLVQIYPSISAPYCESSMCVVQVFPQHLSGVCDITRCMYDRELYTEAAAGTPAVRLLAVADLQRHEDFDLLFRMTAYRREHRLGNSQKALNLTVSVVSHITNGGGRTDTGAHDADASSGSSLVVASSINLVVGVNSLYALELIERLVRVALPAHPIGRRYAMDAPVDHSGFVFVHEIDAHIHLLRTLSVEEVQQLSSTSERTLLVLGVLDCASRNYSAPSPSQQLLWTVESQHMLDAAKGIVGADKTMLLSGEPLDLSALLPGSVDVLITATTQITWRPPGVPALYVPVLSSALFELNAHSAEGREYSARELLVPSKKRNEQQLKNNAVVVGKNGSGALAMQGRKRRIAYLYFRCDRQERENFFDILRATLPVGGVQPLGRCGGAVPSSAALSSAADTSGEADDQQRINSRSSRSYLSEAVELYSAFQFVVAFENSEVPGYITEKLLTAFLAGAIPVYVGAPDVLDYFNPAAMIHCGALVRGDEARSLRECAERVKEALSDPRKLDSLRAAAPVVNMTAWSVLFPWEADAAPIPAAGEFIHVLTTSLVGLV